jgi:predicted dehydrogenase
MSKAASSGSLKIRIGIIGSGDIAASHFRGYTHAGVEVVAVCDSDSTRLAARQHEWEVEKGYLDYRDLLADPSVDAVSICTPNSSHHAITVAAAAAGKHVLCEKPVSLDLVQGAEMISACAAAGVVFQVGHHMRSWSTAMKAKEMIDAGVIGRVCEIRIRQAHDWGGGDGPRGVFGSKEKSGGGTLLDNGCHLFDLARYMGGSVAEVYARIAMLKYETEVEDTAVANLSFASGAIGIVEAAWTATGFQEAFCIYGTEGTLQCDSHDGATTLLHRFRSPGAKGWGDTSVARMELVALPAHTQHVGNFLASIRGERPVICTGQDGLEAVRLVLACYDSALRNVPVAIAE